MNHDSIINTDILESSTAISLLEAGIDQFGLFGLKATTRSIALEAKANIASIPYYFRNKLGLYEACMHYIVDNILKDLGHKFASIDSKLTSITHDEAEALFVDVIDSFCAYFMQGNHTLRWSQFIMREHATPTQAYEIFFNRYYINVQRIQAKLFAKCTGQQANDPSVAINCHAIFSQVLGFLVARESILRALGTASFSNEQVLQTRQIVQQNTRAILHKAQAC